MRKLTRVLTITNMLPHAGEPYFGNFVDEQVRSLRDAGVSVDVFFIEGYKNKWNYFGAISQLRRLRGKYDVFHAHHLYATLPAYAAGVRPLVSTLHDNGLLRSAFYRYVARAVARRIDAMISVSCAATAALQPAPVVAIPMGIDTTLFRPRDRFSCRHELGLSATAKYVLFPANPRRPEKRIDLAEAAVEKARAKEPALQLLVTGHYPRAQMGTLFGAADVILVTSDPDSELGPLTVKEAIAAARPVVSRRVGDVEFLEKCRDCFIVGDTSAEIAEGIIRALAVDTVDHTAAGPYSLEAVARRLIDLYEEVANIRRNRDR